MEACVRFVSRMRVAKYSERSVICIGYGNLGRIGVITGCAGCYKIVLVITGKMRRCLSYIRRMSVRKMS